MSGEQTCVAVDARMANMTGIGRYLRTLVGGLQGLPLQLAVLSGPGVHTTARNQIALRSGPFSLRAHAEIPRALAAHKIDILHSPHFDVPLFWSGRQVTTIHDCAPHVVAGELAGRRALLYYRLMMRLAIGRSDALIADSQFTKAEICRLYRVPAGRIHVIHPGLDPAVLAVPGTAADTASTLARYGIGEDFGLYVGLPRPRKNLKRLMAALGLVLPLLGPSAQFVFAGKDDKRFINLRAEAASLGIGDQVVVTGEVTAAELLALYSCARLFAFPSLYEGFGLPVLEAMAAGLPVLTSTASSLPEVVGDAALLVDPLDTEATADGLTRLWTDEQLRQSLRERGLARVERFSVRRFVEETAAVYATVMNA